MTNSTACNPVCWLACCATARLEERAGLGFRDLEALPQVLRDSRSALLIVRTDQGNLARLLVSPGFRKPTAPGQPLRPILVLERFDVFDGGNDAGRLARGKNMVLFAGFQVDLDSGQVVPAGLGGDLLFAQRGEEDGAVSAVGRATIFTLEKAPELPAPAAGTPSDGKIARPEDFNGRFRLAAGGQWSGLLELAVDAAGSVSGSFLSDASGSSYAVSGKVDDQLHQKIQFTIQFPRARQDYQGILWTSGKQVIAGTLTMQNQESSFVAVREGSRLNLGEDPEAMATVAPGKPLSTWLRVRVETEPDRYSLGTTRKTGAELTEWLARAVKGAPVVKVLIVAPESAPYERVLRGRVCESRRGGRHPAGARAIGALTDGAQKRGDSPPGIHKPA